MTLVYEIEECNIRLPMWLLSAIKNNTKTVYV